MTTPEEFRPNDTLSMRIARKSRTSRPVRETVGSTPGVAISSLIVWTLNQAGVDIPGDVAVTFGGVLSTLISAVIRRQLMKGN